MKKILISTVCVVSILSMSTLAFAAPISKPVPIEAQQKSVESYAIEINGAKLDLGSLKIYKMNNTIIVPLRKTAEALGFKVIWNDQDKSTELDNDVVKTNLVISEDSYYMCSSKAIGMSAPTSLGVAPIIIGDTMYVPVKLYNILYCNENTVVMKDNTITINTDGKKDVVDDKNVSTSIPCPFTEYKSIADVQAVSDFKIKTPNSLPDNYKLNTSIMFNDKSLVEFIYSDGKDGKIVYRMGKGNSDISGDYNVYTKKSQKTIKNAQVTIQGDNDKVKLATWSMDSMSYSISFSTSVDYNTLEKTINSIE